jgi:hypothetical protein
MQRAFQQHAEAVLRQPRHGVDLARHRQQPAATRSVSSRADSGSNWRLIWSMLERSTSSTALRNFSRCDRAIRRTSARGTPRH